MLGRTAFSFVYPDDLERIADAFQEDVENKEQGRDEFRLWHKDGYYIWVETVGNLVYDENGEVTETVMASRDITGWKQANRERDLLFSLSMDIPGIARFDGYFVELSPAAEKT